jgi:hypothetical protein
MTNSFRHVSRKVRNIKISRAFITLGLKARIERFLSNRQLGYSLPYDKYTYSGETDFIAKLIESTDAQFRLTNVKVFGKTEAVDSQQLKKIRRNEGDSTLCKLLWRYR